MVTHSHDSLIYSSIHPFIQSWCSCEGSVSLCWVGPEGWVDVLEEREERMSKNTDGNLHMM